MNELEPTYCIYLYYEVAVAAALRSLLHKVAVVWITVTFHGQSPVFDEDDPTAFNVAKFYHISSCQLNNPMVPGFIPVLTENDIDDEFTELTGAMHPTHRFSVYDTLFHHGQH